MRVATAGTTSYEHGRKRALRLIYTSDDRWVIRWTTIEVSHVQDSDLLAMVVLEVEYIVCY